MDLIEMISRILNPPRCVCCKKVDKTLSGMKTIKGHLCNECFDFHYKEGEEDGTHKI